MIAKEGAKQNEMADIDESAVNRFTDPIGILISRNAQGEITYPTDPEEIRRALRIERAWATYYANGDDTLLIEVGLFPERSEENRQSASERRRERMAAHREATRMRRKSATEVSKLSSPTRGIMELIRRATWREAVTYRDTWPHEYVMVKKDRQEELLAAFCARIAQGEGVECRFFHRKRKYLFLGVHKYWTMTDCPEIDLDTDDYVLNRALLYRDRRDFVIRHGDTGIREE